MFEVQYICLQSWAPVRGSESSASEMVTSLLFGETCTAIGEKNDWLQIKTNHDGYAGYIPKSYLVPFEAYSNVNWQVVLEPYTYLKSEFSVIQLSPGSKIPVSKIISIDGMAYQWVSGLGEKKIINVLEHAKWFLNTPYLWGGRSIFGIDCSGFVQVLAQMAHLKMPRDAYQQALMGQRRMWHNKQVGDLAYFENDSGKITHVGILFTPNTIIHASGKVRIDELTPKGIVHTQTKELTHKLIDIRTWTL